MSQLVDRLSVGDHSVEVSLRPQRTMEALKQCLDRNYIHIKFVDTRGGTELGVRLDNQLTKLDKADFEKGEGAATLVGNLRLDYVNVRCVAEIDLASFAGKGRLEILPG